MTTGSRMRKATSFSDAEIASGDAHHRAKTARSCDRLLERLVKHHERETAPAGDQQEPFEEGAVMGDQGSAF
jgi:hypothetical protein